MTPIAKAPGQKTGMLVRTEGWTAGSGGIPATSVRSQTYGRSKAFGRRQSQQAAFQARRHCVQGTKGCRGALSIASPGFEGHSSLHTQSVRARETGAGIERRRSWGLAGLVSPVVAAVPLAHVARATTAPSTVNSNVNRGLRDSMAPSYAREISGLMIVPIISDPRTTSAVVILKPNESQSRMCANISRAAV